jgi:hypothetical protein
MRGCLLALIVAVGASPALAQHTHSNEALTATAAFGSDGTLWLVRGSAEGIVVGRSSDEGRTFSSPVAVNRSRADIDWGPDARPRIVVAPDGEAIVTFAIFQDKRFNGRAYYARSTGGGTAFTEPTPVTADATSQRFETAGIDPSGRLFAAWLDKRNVARSTAAGRPYAGAALAFAWADGATGFGDTHIAADNTCECCRLGLAFAGPGRPAVMFRNIFAGSIRDHAVVTFENPDTPGPLRRVSVDDWKTEACPHHGPSLAIAPDGSQHAAWFTDGAKRQGLFYARSEDAKSPFGQPRALSPPERQPSRPHVLATVDALHLVWKEFDGDKTQIRWQVSHDRGLSWSVARTVAETADASDHPLLVARGTRAYLSWLTKLEGYRLLPLGTGS